MANTIDAISSALQQYVVAPLNAFGVGGFVFDVEGDSVAVLASDITDHWTEDNRALQDHIAIRPKRVTLKGYVGELVYSPEGNETSFVQKVVQKLTVVNSYLPALSSAAQQIQESVSAGSVQDIPLSAASNIYSVVKNALASVGGNSSQKNAFAYFQACQQQGILMGIQTPWEFITNMAIETIVAVQNEDTRYVTDFSVTFKQIRIASTQLLPIPGLSDSGAGGSATNVANPLINAIGSGNISQGIAALQKAREIAIGIVPGVTLPSASLPSVQAGITAASSFTSIPSLQNIFEIPGS